MATGNVVFGIQTGLKNILDPILPQDAATKAYVDSGSGGNATPGGSDTQLQYNSNGNFAGIPSATFSSGNLTLGSVANIKITGGSNNQTLTTDGTGNLSFTTPPVQSSLANGNASVHVYANPILGDRVVVDLGEGFYANSFVFETFTTPGGGGPNGPRMRMDQDRNPKIYIGTDGGNALSLSDVLYIEQSDSVGNGYIYPKGNRVFFGANGDGTIFRSMSTQDFNATGISTQTLVTTGQLSVGGTFFGQQGSGNANIFNTLSANLVVSRGNISASSNVSGSNFNFNNTGSSLGINAGNANIDVTATRFNMPAYVFDTRSIGGPKSAWNVPLLTSASTIQIGGNAAYTSSGPEEMRGIQLNSGSNTRGAAGFQSTYDFTTIPDGRIAATSTTAILLLDADCQFNGNADGIWFGLGTNNLVYAADGSDDGIGIYFDQYNDAPNGGSVQIWSSGGQYFSTSVWSSANYLRNNEWHKLRVALIRNNFNGNIAYNVYVYIDGSICARSTASFTPTNWGGTNQIPGNKWWGVTGWTGGDTGSHYVKNIQLSSPQQWIYENPSIWGVFT